jgi:hypothetical protein
MRMVAHRFPSCVVVICLAMALIACSPSATAPTAAVPTKAATATTPVDPCKVSLSAMNVKGLTISPQAQLGDLAYPAAKLPDTVTQQPLVSWIGTDGQLKFNPDPAHPTNPLVGADVGGGYVLTILNSTTTAHTVQRIDVCLDSLIPATGALQEWQPCNGSYTRSTGGSLDPRMIGGCGGNVMQNEYLHASFTAHPLVGTVVTATHVTAPSDSYSEDDGPLPVTLPSGASMTIEIGVGPTEPSPTCPVSSTGWPVSGCVFGTPATYVFAFGVAVDGAAPVFAATSAPTLLAPAKEWTREACITPAMQALIPPATAPPTYYICPES